MLLPARKVEKPWGLDTLPPPFATPDGQRIGEIWFEPPREMPDLLVKYLFTSEKLSIQCHPSHAQTEAKGLGRQGKEECWLVVDAEPGATLGIGFTGAIDAETMRAAALDGSIEQMLTWHEVEAGDFFYLPANTVHAIGPGCSIIEIQQNSDITYRLFDYGRPRELHLEEALEVADGSPYPAKLHRKIPAGKSVTLVDGPYFTLDRVVGRASEDIATRYYGQLLVIPRRGDVLVEGEPVWPGQCALADSLGEVTFSKDGEALIAQPLG